jgi:ubiquinone/menaquinone biosynthesis C-methylase UbiE
VFIYKKAEALDKAKKQGKNPAEAKLDIIVIREDKESDRIDLAAEWAEIHGLNPHFARGIMYELINESCKVQLEAIQTNRDDIRLEDYTTSNEWYEALKTNLLKLTNHVAADYDKAYSEKTSFTVATYRQFELQILADILDRLPNQKLALDLGCATGPISLHLAKDFNHVEGYDISRDMIEIAQKNAKKKSFKNVSFAPIDIEGGLPVDDNVASLVVLNQGVASEVLNIKGVMKEIERVLRPRGKVFLSFYNKEALLYQFDFIPWPVNLFAEINFKAQCLEVNIPGHEPFFIFAKGYSSHEVENLFEGKMMMDEIYSFPTLSPILPKHLLKDDKILTQLENLDKSLANSTSGSYLIAVGTKR